ncbi:MAG: PorT family protein [Ferruginibacter sp.]|nr:PorT family protein [Ferruginibacter sp.]
MKRKIITLAILLGLTGPLAFAQSVKLGIKGGADLNKIDGKSFKDEFSFGYHVGGFAEIGLTSRFGIQPEVMFSQVNIDTATNYSSVYNFNNISSVQLKYLKIPILLNYMPNKFVALQVGPQFSINLDDNKDIFENGKAAFKSGDFSMVGGLQLNISKIKLYGRYAVGLSNINDIDNQEKWKNQSIQLGVGLTF